MNFNNILEKYRKHSFSEHDKGYRFERLMQAYLLTDPQYTGKFKKVWMWNDFFGKDDLGGSDTGIDLVAQTVEGDFWAIQCKCYQADAYIDKPAVDSFLSTSSREFMDEEMKTTGFAHRLWISTTNKWGGNAEEAIRNQHPPVTRINLYDLQQAPVDWGKLEEGIHGEPARSAKKQLRPHQKEALDKVHEHFKRADRGKLIMACGTGKTFNSLRIAENETQGKGLILFLVPSIALLGQTLREWSADAENPLNAICVCSDPEVSRKKTKNEDPVTGTSPGNGTATKEIAEQLNIQFEQLQHIVFARMVQKVGDRRYWEQWAKSVAGIAERQIERIGNMIKSGDYRQAFENFLVGLQKNINPSVTQREAIEMLSQHIITKPVFEALFEGYSFVKHNPISISMQTMLELLETSAIEKDTETLQKFYESVRMRASGIDNAEGKQRIIIELYDKFFKTAFPRMVERLGIVYTPIEVVDFIIHSVDDVLKQEFGRSISDENVHILDPFTGTGTFITRLIQSGLIRPEDLERKYRHELFANEIVLLAYYIAAVNIENAFHDKIASEEYLPFDGICLTDTFQLFEDDDDYSELFPHNSELIIKQKGKPITVIMGNPPYSIGQKSANDNAQNQEYPKLNRRIEATYAKASNAGLNKSLYDAYIKAFRWSSDRLGNNDGVIAFVSNGAWIDGNSTDGFRQCLEREFSKIYVFNLRGNQRTSGELSRREGGKIFGSGSRTPIAITILVKKGGKQ